MFPGYEISIFVFMALSFFFSSSETAIISANPIRLRSLAEQGSARAGRAVKIIKSIEDSIGMTLIGNNIVNIAAASFVTFLASRHMALTELNVVIITALETVVFLIFCEVLPKVIARDRADALLMLYSLPLQVFMMGLYPLIRISMGAASFLKRRFGIPEEGSSFVKSRDEIVTLFRMGKSEGIIKKRHQEFVNEILGLHEITVREIMTPTIDMVSIERGEGLKRLVSLIGSTRFSRIPVYEDRVDNIVGYVFYRDLLDPGRARRIEDVIRKPFFVPSTKKIDELFVEMEEKGVRIFFVVNEYGGVEGLVTAEDIVEELVGEIQTRDHPRTDLIKELGNRRYLVSGGIDIEYFQGRFGLKAEKRGFETLAGLICYHLGRIPEAGEKLRIDDYVFQIQEATERSVESVIIVVPPGKKQN